jgi:hypothetical protein
VAGDGGNYSAAKDFGYNARGFCGAVDAMVGLLVGRKTLRVERAEAGLVAEKRPASHSHAAAEQNIEGGVKPDDGDSGSAKKFGRAGLRVGAAAEREHQGFPVFDGAAESGAELIGFDLTKRGLAEAFENFRDAKASGFFNPMIEIDKAPRELAGKQRADGGFAGTHEAGEAKDRQARW